MPRPVAHLLDPALADAADPCAGYNPEAEPLEDRLYLPVGVDPHGDICGVVFAHPYPQSKEVLTQRIIRNNNLQDMRWLIETGVTTGCLVPGPARLRLRGHQRLLAGATQLSAPRRQCHCHGLRSPDQPRPWQWHARCHGRPQRRLHHHQGLQAGRVTCHAHPPGTVSLVARVLPLAPLRAGQGVLANAWPTQHCSKSRLALLLLGQAALFFVRLPSWLTDRPAAIPNLIKPLRLTCCVTTGQFLARRLSLG
jgi:hypothetical protein